MPTRRGIIVPDKHVAVVGGGIAGAGAAWLLAGRHRVTLFEAEDYVGGHTCTIDARLSDGHHPVDTGFMVFNPRNYPHLCALFDHLGIEAQASDMSFACADRDDDLEYNGESLRGLFAQRRNLVRPGFLRMVYDILRFNRRAKRDLAGSLDDHLPLGEYLDAGGYGPGFRRHYLMPMAAAIWSASPSTLRAFPARRFLAFFRNHGLLDLADRPQWHTVPGGARRYIDQLLPALHAVHTSTPVRRVQRLDAGGVRLSGDDGELGEFDEVVLAAHADQTLAMLDAPTDEEARLLGQCRFQDNLALLHTDPSAMPQRRRIWASWNHISAADEQSRRPVSVTYWLNRLQQVPSEQNIFVSLNPVDAIDDAYVQRRLAFTHPVLDGDAAAAQDALPAIQGRDRLWFCGAWTGFGFHEDGLRSAVRVAEQLGCPPPWGGEAQAAPASATAAAGQPAGEAA
nr:MULTISPECIES: FAD-dependent oxidoreductase [Halorhodospira]